MSYPNAPGWKARDTSRDAAVGVAPKATTLKQRILTEIRAAPGTPEEIAARLGEPLMNCRPRFSELSAARLVRDTGQRRVAAGGRRAIVWGAA